MTTAAPRGPELDAVQRRTVTVLFVAQMVAGLGMGAGMSIGSLLAYEVTRDEALAGASRVISGLAIAVIAVPLARLASTRGRRVALSLGWLAASIGAALLVLAVARHSIALLMVGMFCFSAGSAASLQARFAATDLARPERRAGTLSLVVWATTVGSVLGPNLAAPGAVVGRHLQLPGIAGAYLLASAVTACGALFTWLALRPDPLLLARGTQPVPGRVAGRAPRAELWHDPVLRLAFVAMACAQFVMASVMVLTPVHMTMNHLSLGAVGATMSIHIFGMYAFSPLVGALVDRAGERTVLWLGSGVLLAALLVAAGAGASMVLLDLALFLLGLGWSLCQVAGSVLVTRAAPDAMRPHAQGLADTTSSLAAAVAAALCGPVMGWVGYRGLAGLAALALLPLVGSLVSGARRRS